MSTILFEEIFTNANDFLDAISLRGKYFGLVNKHTWIFRGQKQSYNLIPSALRNESDILNLVKFIQSRSDINILNNKMQFWAEALITQKFFFIADHRGFPLPEDSQELRSLILEYINKPKNNWPPKNLLSLLALAQHHGLPTRLLDWSWNPNIAAYFAARGAVELLQNDKEKQDEYLEVIALSLDVLDNKFILEHLKPTANINYIIELVTTPGSSNKNLVAQEGVSTLIKSENVDLNGEIVRISVEDFIKNIEKITDNLTSVPLFYKFYLPIKESKYLFYLLCNEGITASKIFPGFDGVVKEIRDGMYFS